MAEPVHPRLHIASAPQPACFTAKQIHLIGIGGSGMSGAARMLMNRGAQVSGSDCIESPMLQRLSAGGATIFVGHDHQNLPVDADLVVASAAVPQDNPELLAARATGKRVIKYSDLLGELMVSATGVAVAGTHGKSTTTAMTAFVCTRAGLNPSFVVGAEVDQLGGASGAGRGDCFIVEACEYDCSFLNLSPTHAVILNVEEDHLDYFRNLNHVVEAFGRFASLVPAHGSMLHNQDDPQAADAASQAKGRIESFGFGEGATWRAQHLMFIKGLPSFEISWHGHLLGRVTLSLPGRHNVYNALASCALAHRCGCDLNSILRSLGRFNGAQRRLSFRGRYRGIDLLDDYAHHPTEIQASLEAVVQRYHPRRLRVIFQPHQVSRTRFFMDDFARSFSLADEVIVPDIYFVRDSAEDRQLISSRDLVDKISQRGGTAVYIPNLDDIAEHLARDPHAGDVVVTMGAGDVWKVADEMVRRLTTSG